MPPDQQPLLIRAASPGDAAAIADLHARSWQSAYRGSFSDSYLDGPVANERRFFWTERLRHHTPGLWTILAERDGVAVGFCCALVDHDPAWGTLVDNLHADPAAKRQGIGRVLLRALGDHLAGAAPGRPVFLFVLDSNHDAGAFYERVGGAPVEKLVRSEPDGLRLPVTRIAWPSVSAFRAGVG